MGTSETVRVDQWLWSVRLTRTRADAASACRSGHVSVNGKPAKPSTSVRTGDRIEARLAQRERIVEVTALLTKRVGAALVSDHYIDHSPPPPELLPDAVVFAQRDRGAGRPTKRDRRDIDRLRRRDR